ncbi:MAG: N-6 DNA methylase [Polyangiaceae bacterium]
MTVLMRMVFVVFAEERGLLPMENELYASSYSLTRLYAQLVEDRGRFGDGMDDRYGAWARIISLFRILHDGVHAADGLTLPARRGDFFSADAYPFLEGRPRGVARQRDEVLQVPRISDGVIYRVLDQLLVLAGERLQYKGLDVEQIGSVYEGLMGFELEVAEGPSLCLTPQHVVVNLERLLRLPAAERVKTLKTEAGLDLKDKAATEVKKAESIEALHAALSKRMSSRQPGLIPMGSLFLQPGEERRKTGSHYTPKSLTAPIVETTLRPIFERLGPEVTPAQILDLKICDPAMGSAAFLVEACRQLADALVAAWRRTGTMPELPPDEDPVLHARRLVAQRCLYGVDKNPLAVSLGRLSLWLVTFAKQHPFTFVDHALRAGDSLVGLTREQIVAMSLDVGAGKQVGITRPVVEEAVKRAEQLRREIHTIGDPPDTERLAALWRDANEALDTVRALGDLVVAAFFSADSDKTRRKAMDEVAGKAAEWLQTGAHDATLRGMLAELREGPKPIRPFHWEIEFPEVFAEGAAAAGIGGTQ